MSDDLWSERDTSPDAIDAALRRLLRKRHAADRALAPARVLNLIVVVDQAERDAVADQLERLGRHSSSRTILCAVADRQRTLDAVVAMSYKEPVTGGFGLIHERVEIGIGPGYIRRLKTIVDPVLIPELPTALWCPQHEEAIKVLLPAVDVVMLDSDRAPEPASGLARAAELARSAYVVDMAWIRTTPWRERLAASFESPARLAALRSLTKVSIRHGSSFLASALLLAGWLASRMRWNAGPLAPRDQGGLRGITDTDPTGAEVEIVLDPVGQVESSIAGVTASSRRSSLSLDEAPGGLRVRERSDHGREEVWRALEAAAGNTETLGEAVRQAMLRDPTYRPALEAARQLCGVGLEHASLPSSTRGDT